MKRILVLSIAAAFLLAVPASHLVFGKGHVPTNKIQVCHKGKVVTVGASALADHLGHGDCQLPACDFSNVFHTGDPCDAIDSSGDGKCDLPNLRDDAGGLTPGCPAGTY